MPRNANQSKSSNYSIDFNGSSQYLDLGDDDIFSFGNSTDDSPFSISAWIYMNDATSFRILNKYNAPNYEYQFDLSSSDKLQFYIFDGSNYRGVGYDSALSINQWYHVVATYDGRGGSSAQSGMVLYVNGSPVNDITYSSGSYTAMHNTTAPVNIGRIASSYANGKIDAVSIFDYALSSSQVTTLYGTGSAIGNPMALPSPPIAYYPLGTSAWNGQYLAENNAIGDYVFDFDGSNYIATGTTLTNLSVSTSFSISCWVKITSNVNYYHIVGAPTSYSAWNTGFGLYTNGSGIRFWVEQWNGENQFVETSSLNNGQWYHIGATFDTTNGLKLYVNAGTPTTATGTTIDGLSNTIFIGSTGTNTTYAFSGDLSNTQIWNTELTSTELETLYNYGSPIRTLANIPQNSNLQGWWKLDASATFDSSTNTWTIPDDSTNSNDGTSSGMSQANLVQSDLQTVAPYSKYAMNFDAADSDNIIVNSNTGLNFGTGDFTYSLWGKINTTASNPGFYGGGSGNNNPSANSGYLSIGVHISQPTGYVGATRCWISGEVFNGTTIITDNNWHNIVLTRTSGVVQIYLDGNIEVMRDSSGTVVTNPTSSNSITNTNGITIGSFRNFLNYINGSMSNASIWNAALTSAQVSELYNEGLPSNLNSHSAYSNLVSWWQLGENSSFDGNDWIVADEKGANNGTSANMTVANLTNGVGTTANGLSSGMSEGNLVGDAPYSTANAISTNMVVTSRVTGSGNTP